MLINGDDVPFAVYPSAVPDEVCDAILNEVVGLTGSAGEVGGGDPTLRRSTVAFLGTTHWVAELLHGAAVRANAEAGWHLDLLGPEAVQVARYATGDSYGWHIDSYTDGEQSRKLSMSLQLTDGAMYEGGDLQFARFGIPELETLDVPAAGRKRGSIIVFPSYLMHRVQPVRDGVRCSVVAWIRGPRFR